MKVAIWMLFAWLAISFGIYVIMSLIQAVWMWKDRDKPEKGDQ